MEASFFVSLDCKMDWKWPAQKEKEREEESIPSSIRMTNRQTQTGKQGNFGFGGLIETHARIWQQNEWDWLIPFWMLFDCESHIVVTIIVGGTSMWWRWMEATTNCSERVTDGKKEGQEWWRFFKQKCQAFCCCVSRSLNSAALQKNCKYVCVYFIFSYKNGRLIVVFSSFCLSVSLSLSLSASLARGSLE